MSIISVIVDSREPEWCKSLQFDGAAVSVEQIDTDYLLMTTDGTLLGIERKTAEDFLSTLRADRLFPQLERLRSLTEWAYLVICGELRQGQSGLCVTEDGRETGWKYSAVTGALLTVQEIGVHVVFCRETDFEQTVLRIAGRDRRSLRIQPARDVSLMSEGEQVLSALPGIGAEKAAALMAHCGSAGWAMTYLTLLGTRDVPGVGDGIKRRVRRALGLPDWASLHVVDANGNVAWKEEANGVA